MSTRLADALVNEIGFNCIEIRAAIPWKGGGDRRKAILTAANLEAVAVSLQPILEAHADWRTAEAGTAIVRAALRALGLPEAQAKGSFDFERQREKRTENKRPPT
jgi:hypothetical protein